MIIQQALPLPSQKLPKFAVKNFVIVQEEQEEVNFGILFFYLIY